MVIVIKNVRGFLTSNTFWIILFCALAIISIIVIYIMSSSEAFGKTAQIFSDNKLVKTVSLEKDDEFTIENEVSKGYNVIRVKDGKISVIESDCKNKICIDHGEIDNDLLPIVCVPNGLVIRVKNDKKSEFDAAV